MALSSADPNHWFDHSAALLPWAGPWQSEPQPSNNEVKKHAACDECRKRKLKCSGEQSGCARCRKQSLKCHYSLQKPMGRPRKRRTRSSDDSDIPPPVAEAWTGKDPVPIYKSVAPEPAAVPDVQPHVDDSVNYQNRYAGSTVFAAGGLPDELQHSFPIALPTPPATYFPVSPNGMQLQDPSQNTSENFTHSSNSHASPQCSCLSYIYLCLSTISNLPPLPTSSNTLSTLHTAARTARSAIKCPECPMGFATSTQNVMLLGTLFNVIGDGWLRVTRTNARELGMHCAPESYAAMMPQDPAKQEEFWKNWQRQVIRRGVIGGKFDPAMYTPELRVEDTPDLRSLISEMEERQKMWHEFGIANYVPGGISKCGKLHEYETKNLKEGRNKPDENGDYLCLRIVGSARALLGRFDFEPEDYLA